LLLGLPSCLFSSGFPTKTSYAFLILPMHATCLAHLIIIDSITLIIFGKAYKYNRDSSVGIALSYGLDDRGSRVRFPAGAGNFSIHHRVQNGSGTHPASYPMGTRGSFLGGETDHSPSSSVEVKNAWSYTSTPPICLHGV
jgi:hypothetical protein